MIHISSPNRPYYYPSELNCIWKFSAHDDPGSFVIHFLTFDTELTNDPLALGRGNFVTADTVIRTFSSWIPPHFVAVVEEPILWMTFTSDFAKSGRGFEIQIDRIKENGRLYIIYIILYNNFLKYGFVLCNFHQSFKEEPHDTVCYSSIFVEITKGYAMNLSNVDLKF